MKKEKLYTFLDGYYLMVIDSLIGRWGNQRSEVIRKIIEEWVDSNNEKLKILYVEKQEALQKGYINMEDLKEIQKSE